MGNGSDVRNVIQLKRYFKGSGNKWDQALEGVMHHDLALCALGGLISHLSRLMVSFPIWHILTLGALNIFRSFVTGTFQLFGS